MSVHNLLFLDYLPYAARWKWGFIVLLEWFLHMNPGVGFVKNQLDKWKIIAVKSRGFLPHVSVSVHAAEGDGESQAGACAFLPNAGIDKSASNFVDRFSSHRLIPCRNRFGSRSLVPYPGVGHVGDFGDKRKVVAVQDARCTPLLAVLIKAGDHGGEGFALTINVACPNRRPKATDVNFVYWFL
jgi:hypothetical protein